MIHCHVGWSGGTEFNVFFFGKNGLYLGLQRPAAPVSVVNQEKLLLDKVQISLCSHQSILHAS